MRSTVLLLLMMTACSTPAIIATQSIQEGDRMNNINRYEEAIRHYEEYLRVSPQLGLYRNPSQEADVCRKLAHAYATQGKYRDAFSYLKRALAMDSTLADNTLAVIDDYRELGIVKAYMGDYREALTWLNKSLDLNEGMERSAKDIKKTSLADTYLSLAQVNLSLGNFRESERYGESALAVYRTIPGEASAVVECQLLLGTVQRDLGDLKEAVTLLRRSVDEARRLGLNTARQHQALGEVFLMRGESEEGIRHKMLAIDEAERSRIKPQMVMMYMRMGDTWQKLGDQKKAEFYYQKAMSMKVHLDGDTLGFMPSSSMRYAEAAKAYDYYAQSGAAMGLALVSLRLGELRSQAGDADSALIMFTAADEAFTKAGSKEGMAKANLELGKVLAKKKIFDGAAGRLEKALSLTRQPDLVWQIKFAIATIEEETGSVDRAFRSYQEAIAVIDDMRGNISIEEFKTLFANTKVEVYDRMILLLLTRDISGLTREEAGRLAFHYNEQARSRTFLDMLGNKRIEAKNIGDTALLAREQLLRLKIQQMSKQQHLTVDFAQQQSLGEELEQAYREFDELIATIKLNNPAYATVMNVDPPDVAEIQKRLDDQTALLEYWVSDKAVVVWTVTARKASATRVALDRSDLQRLLTGCRNSIAYRDVALMQRSLRQLHQTLVEPVLEEIHGFKKLVVIPHRTLHFLPFQALITTRNTFLVEDFVITYAPAASVYAYCKEREVRPGSSFLGVALADFGFGNLPPLPGTEAEVKVLSQLYPQSESRFGADCEETSLKQTLPAYDYVHIATHGVFNPHEPVYSYLLMAPSEQDDGRLTVDEIFGLNMRSRLVSLSACETALGELSQGDELVGLSRAFIYAGAPAVLVSLWKVEDSSTAFLMTRFHQYIASGKTAGEALSLAQRELIRRDLRPEGVVALSSPDFTAIRSSLDVSTLDNPFFWAPFVLVGNGDVR